MKLVSAALFTLFLASTAVAAPISVDTDASIFAVVTHKAGVAARLAHNHLIVAQGYDVSLDLDAKNLAQAFFALEFPAAELVVDDPALQAAWYPRLEELALLDEPFSEVSESDRDKISQAMLSQKQLDAEQFPTLSAELVFLKEGTTQIGQETFTHRATLAFTVHGTRVEKEIAAQVEFFEDGVVEIEAVGEFAFSEFGIKAYSAMLGAVKNQDAFHVFVLIRGSAE